MNTESDNWENQLPPRYRVEMKTLITLAQDPAKCDLRIYNHLMALAKQMTKTMESRLPQDKTTRVKETVKATIKATINAGWINPVVGIRRTKMDAKGVSPVGIPPTLSDTMRVGPVGTPGKSALAKGD